MITAIVQKKVFQPAIMDWQILVKCFPVLKPLFHEVSGQVLFEKVNVLFLSNAWNLVFS